MIAWAMLEPVPDPMFMSNDGETYEDTDDMGDEMVGMATRKLKKTAKDKKTGIPKKYLPKSLSPSDRKKQLKSLKSKTNQDRPKVSSFKSKRSPHVEKFEKRYGHKITDDAFISKNIISKEGIRQILAKGRGAYKSGGSRPNQSASSWARARLASVITGGKARAVDQKIWDQYKIKK